MIDVPIFELLVILLLADILAEVDKHLWARVCWRLMAAGMGIAIILKFITEW